MGLVGTDDIKKIKLQVCEFKPPGFTLYVQSASLLTL